MSKDAGVAALVLGIAASIAGFVAWSWFLCVLGPGGPCFAGGYPYLGYPYLVLLAMIFGGVLFVVGIVLIAIVEKTLPEIESAPYDYYPQPQAYSPPVAQPKPVQALQRFCPTCGNHYPQDYKLCPRDGTELRAVQ